MMRFRAPTWTLDVVSHVHVHAPDALTARPPAEDPPAPPRSASRERRLEPAAVLVAIAAPLSMPQDRVA